MFDRAYNRPPNGTNRDFRASKRYEKRTDGSHETSRYAPANMCDRSIRSSLCEGASVKKCRKCNLCEYGKEFVSRVDAKTWKYTKDYEGYAVERYDKEALCQKW